MANINVRKGGVDVVQVTGIARSSQSRHYIFRSPIIICNHLTPVLIALHFLASTVRQLVSQPRHDGIATTNSKLPTLPYECLPSQPQEARSFPPTWHGYVFLTITLHYIMGLSIQALFSRLDHVRQSFLCIYLLSLASSQSSSTSAYSSIS